MEYITGNIYVDASVFSSLKWEGLIIVMIVIIILTTNVYCLITPFKVSYQAFNVY